MQFTDNDFNSISKFIDIPTLLFNSDEIIAVNSGGSQLDISAGLRKHMAAEYSNVEEFYCDAVISKNQSDLDMRMSGKWVNYQGKKYVLAQFFDTSYSQKLLSKVVRLSKARELMLEISLSIAKMNDINSIYNLIMKNVMQTMDKSALATIFTRKDDDFYVVAQSGYTDEIFDLKLPVHESFLAISTGQRMDKISNITDLSIYYDHYLPIKIEGDKELMIRSTLTAPLYVNGELIGMMNIDSAETNAFSEEDIEIMEFVKSSVEIALSNRAYIEKIDYMATHDMMTGLINRSSFQQMYQDHLNECKQGNVWIVVFDINGLKTMNDSYGHLWGDRMIQDVADKLKITCKKNDMLARMGGDEFLGLFHSETKEALVARFEIIQREFTGNPYHINQKRVWVSFSYGIAEYGADGVLLQKLIVKADDRMYKYKNEMQKSI